MPIDAGQRQRGHLMLREIGGAGVQKLAHARVLIIGAGGLGAPLALFLAQAGVGHITLADDDVVAPSDLARQGLFGEKDVGRLKAGAAVARLRHLVPHVSAAPHFARLRAQTIMPLLEKHDLIADATDNFASRFLVADACYFARRPLVSAAVEGWSGQLACFRPYEQDKEGNPLPTYRCLVAGNPPEPGSCAQGGLAGPLCSALAGLQALEAMKEITGAGERLAGRLLLLDALTMRTRIIRLPFDPQNPLTGKGQPPILDLSIHQNK